eukprot:GFYU01004593.1.p1 GENE.GFYU01004593.1~~GFYU01004593.1.p1  ORF type:complete len:738 (-),score=196.32 GFYU01004593.1:144-2219(-)
MFEVDYSKIYDMTEMAAGAGSTVYKGTLVDANGGHHAVAVKKPRITESDVVKRFHRERELLDACAHPNIVEVAGVCTQPPNYSIVMKYYERGSVGRLVHDDKLVRGHWPLVYHTVLEMARAIQHLHQLGVIHRDIKASNFFVDDELNIHLGDFDVAEYTSVITEQANDLQRRQHELGHFRSRKGELSGMAGKRTVGTLVNMAPEVLKNTGIGIRNDIVYTPAADVYSFGISANEVATGTIPYADRFTDDVHLHTVLDMNYNQHTLSIAIATSGLRPVNVNDLSVKGGNNGIPEEFGQLLRECWDQNPALRPSMDDVVNRLEAMAPANFADFDAASFVAEREGHMATPMDIGADTIVATGDSPATTLRKAADRMGDGVIMNNSFLVGGQDKAKNAAANSAAAKYQSRKGVDRELLRELNAREIVAGGFDTHGRRGPDCMEDRYFVHEDVCDGKYVSVTGVFDGHGGVGAAEYANTAMPPAVLSHLQDAVAMEDANNAIDWDDVMTAAFTDINTDFERAFPQDTSGCTAMSAVVYGNTLAVANAGDCRAVLCNNGTAIPLSNDHTAAAESERNRVKSMGGTVEFKDTWRVGGALQVTRALGDLRHKPYVTAEPEVITRELQEGDHFLVMATDGVWDYVSNQEAVNMVLDTVKVPNMCAKRIVLDAYSRGSDDNLTLVVVFLRAVTTCEQVYSG